MMNENCWILIGGSRDDLWWGKRSKPTEGEPCMVRFNAKYVLEREEKYHDIVGFIHTHPNFSAHYSMRDDRTMKAWVCAFGKPLVCCIQGTDGLRAWWYLDDENPPVEDQAKSLRGIVFGLVPEELIYDSADANNKSLAQAMIDGDPYSEIELPLDGPNSDICFHCGKQSEDCECG